MIQVYRPLLADVLPCVKFKPGLHAPCMGRANTLLFATMPTNSVCVTMTFPFSAVNCGARVLLLRIVAAAAMGFWGEDRFRLGPRDGFAIFGALGRRVPLVCLFFDMLVCCDVWSPGHVRDCTSCKPMWGNPCSLLALRGMIPLALNFTR